MINPKNIEIEYISGSVFALAGLILSLLIGIAAGNAISLILIRSFIITIIFMFLGFACVIVIKKNVPEIYQLLNSVNKNGNNKNSDDLMKEGRGVKSAAEGPVKNEPDSLADSNKYNEELNNIKDNEAMEQEFSTVDSIPDEETHKTTKEGSLSGAAKVIPKDKKIRYEPKIAAQAIRTMMKRDE